MTKKIKSIGALALTSLTELPDCKVLLLLCVLSKAAEWRVL